jgi:molecular chaperone GrpE
MTENDPFFSSTEAPGSAGSSNAARAASDGLGSDQPGATSSDGIELSPEALAIAAAKADAEKARVDNLYLRAEFENYKKQVIKERSDLRKYGSERLLTELLGVLDIFETALATDGGPEAAATFRKGIELTANALRSTLARFGVEEIPADAIPFDPSVHEALSSEETDRVPPGHVAKVFKKPYKLHDRVIRPGQVVVAKAKS